MKSKKAKHMKAKRIKKPKEPKPSGMRKYWPHLTLKEAEAERQKLSDLLGAKCALCKKPESSFKTRLAVDHNHKTGKVRGLLCYRCNKFIVGRHTIETARAVLAYLERFDKEVRDDKETK